MSLVGVSLFGDHAGAPLVDIAIDNGLIAAITPSTAARSPRRLAMPALANAHDHARPLSPTSFGGAGKPLETWLLRLAALPAIDPYLGALAAFGRAARGGAASVMAHYTRLHGPMSPIDEVSEVARAARDVGIRVTFAMFMRDRNPLVYGPPEPVLAAMPIEARRIVEAQFLYPMPGVAEQVARVEAIAAAVESPTFTVQFGPSGPQWCSDALLGAIAQASARTGRRVHMHLLETIYQRAFADRAYPNGIATHLRDIGLLSKRSTSSILLRRRAPSSPQIPARTCICARASRRSARRSGEAAASRSVSIPRRSTRTTILYAKCGSAISCTAAGASKASLNAGHGWRRSSPMAASPMARRAQAR
jgi:cytosine/adenosine deaminase-related metal-dependent hydrolase